MSVKIGGIASDIQGAQLLNTYASCAFKFWLERLNIHFGLALHFVQIFLNEINGLMDFHYNIFTYAVLRQDKE